MKRDPLNKEYYRISEVSALLELPHSTLRFWETQFPIIAPYRDSKGNRFYRPKDIENLKMIKFLVKERGLKIEAAQAEIKNNKAGVDQRAKTIERLKSVRDQLQEILDVLNSMKK